MIKDHSIIIMQKSSISMSLHPPKKNLYEYELYYRGTSLGFPTHCKLPSTKKNPSRSRMNSTSSIIRVETVYISFINEIKRENIKALICLFIYLLESIIKPI